MPLAVFFTLCFYAPDLSLTARIIWAFATYIPLGMIQTMLLIPWHAQTVIMTGYLLAYFKYIPDQNQTDSTLFGISIMLYVVPAIAQLLAFVTLSFYDLTEDKHRKIVEAITY